MKHNMGKADRIVRSMVGIGLVYAIFSKTVDGTIAVVSGLVAVMMLVTAITGYCPPYGFLGIKTCKCEEHDEEPFPVS